MLLLLSDVDKVVGAAALLASPQPAGEGDDKVSPFDQFSPPRTSYQDNLSIHAPEASVCNANPAAWPAYASFPLACCPEEERSDDAGDEADLLQHVDEPVLGTTNAFAIVTGPQPKQVKTEANPYDQQAQHKRILAAAGAEGEVLAPQAGLENQQIQIYLRRRRGQE